MASWLVFHLSIDENVHKLEERMEAHERKQRMSLEKAMSTLHRRMDMVEQCEAAR